MKAAAALSDDPKVALAAKQAEAALKNLEVQSDLVGQKINGVFSDAFGDAFADFITGTKTASEAFRSFANSVISQLARMAAQEVASGLFSGGGSGWSSLLNLGGLFGGARASGGPVAANTMYRVNELGPELFQAANGSQFLMTGAQAGRIVPNSALGGGGQIVQNNYMTVGDVPSTAAVRAEIAQAQRAAAARLQRSRDYGGIVA